MDTLLISPRHYSLMPSTFSVGRGNSYTDRIQNKNPEKTSVSTGPNTDFTECTEHPITDSFQFNTPQSVLKMNDPETKRSLLSIASKIFDPVGLLTPFTVKAKILFQDLWQRELEWEDQLDEEVAAQWRSWKSDLPCLSRINIPRHFMANGRSIIKLRGFGGASPKAYGVAVYIQTMDAAGKVSTHLVMSK